MAQTQLAEALLLTRREQLQTMICNGVDMMITDVSYVFYICTFIQQAKDRRRGAMGLSLRFFGILTALLYSLAAVAASQGRGDLYKSDYSLTDHRETEPQPQPDFIYFGVPKPKPGPPAHPAGKWRGGNNESFNYFGLPGRGRERRLGKRKGTGRVRPLAPRQRTQK
jgi:hypothetical protein